MGKILVFGTGQFYNNNKKKLERYLENDIIVAFIDNRAGEIGSFENKSVYSPAEIHSLSYDKILLMSVHDREMKEQLISLGVSEDYIVFFWRYICEKSHGKIWLRVAKFPSHGKRVLIISYALNYGGGTLAAVYAAMSLYALGYDVCIATQDADEHLAQQILSKGIHVLICPAIPCLEKEELYWMMQFDMVIVNVFQMIRVACEVSKYKPILWWIHESSNKFSDIYPRYRYWFAEYDNVHWMRNLNIYAVSEVAKRNFEEYYPEMVTGILPYGIPDEATHSQLYTVSEPREKCIFAVIGVVSKLKAQDIFLNAAKKLMEKYAGQAEFWLVGSCGSSPYVKEIQQFVKDFPAAKSLGKMPRKELGKLYRNIDVVVCASLEETMSMTIIESMMHGKVCITTNATGIADYIKDGENGFVCEAGDAEALCEKMVYLLNHKEQCRRLGENARKTYEKFFSMGEFGKRLEQTLLETEQAYAKRHF